MWGSSSVSFAWTASERYGNESTGWDGSIYIRYPLLTLRHRRLNRFLRLVLVLPGKNRRILIHLRPSSETFCIKRLSSLDVQSRLMILGSRYSYQRSLHWRMHRPGIWTATEGQASPYSATSSLSFASSSLVNLARTVCLRWLQENIGDNELSHRCIRNRAGSCWILRPNWNTYIWIVILWILLPEAHPCENSFTIPPQ